MPSFNGDLRSIPALLSLPPIVAAWQDQRMRWKGLSRRVVVPGVPSMTGPERPAPPAGSAGRPAPIDRTAVQYLDRVRAIFRPARGDAVAPGLERFIGREDIFRHVGTGSDGAQPLMQCPVHWPIDVRWVPIGDLEILEILEDQDVRAG
jgi:hypothetical protein